MPYSRQKFTELKSWAYPEFKKHNSSGFEEIEIIFQTAQLERFLNNSKP